MIQQWKKALLEGASEIFQRGRDLLEPELNPTRIKKFQAKIGKLTTEREFWEQGLRLLPGRSTKR